MNDRKKLVLKAVLRISLLGLNWKQLEDKVEVEIT